jgi:hypothetical protein
MNRLGLALNSMGSIAVGWAGYNGLTVGFGGPIVWKNKIYHLSWLMGWILNAIGFLLQFLSVH